MLIAIYFCPRWPACTARRLSRARTDTKPIMTPPEETANTPRCCKSYGSRISFESAGRCRTFFVASLCSSFVTFIRWLDRLAGQSIDRSIGGFHSFRPAIYVCTRGYFFFPIASNSFCALDVSTEIFRCFRLFPSTMRLCCSREPSAPSLRQWSRLFLD